MKNSIYIDLGPSEEKDTSGHLKHQYRCKECGAIVLMRPYWAQFSNKCHHTRYHFNNVTLSHNFSGMLKRCYNPKCKDYRWYGAKGVKICDEWLNDPTAFADWALTHGFKEGLTIDRIDSTKDYCPENCQWIIREENARKAGKVNWITVNGITHTGREWANILQAGMNRINRMKREKGEEFTKEFISKRLKELNIEL